MVKETEQYNATSRDTPQRRRLRVLISAQAVSPVRGSEPGVGWNLISRLAAWHDVTVLCSPISHGEQEQFFREEVQKYVEEHGSRPGLTFQFVDPPLLCKWFQYETGVRRRTLYYLGYKSWQKKAYMIAKRLHAQRPFELVHHLNLTGYREPGYLWKLPAPFVWGPITGAADIPFAYLPLMGWSDRLFYAVRNISNAIYKQTSWRCRSAAETARHIWAVGRETMEMINDDWGYPAENLVESGAVVRIGMVHRNFHASRPLRLVWSGQHIGRKALPILLHALKRLRDNDEVHSHTSIELSVLGQGPETERWKATAAKLGLNDCIRWVGQLPQETALREVAKADTFVHTSIQEGTPHVILEALSLGVPVICHDTCGMSVAINDTCGIKIQMLNPEVSVSEFASAIRSLLINPDKIDRLSAGAIARAEELSWDKKAWHIAERYWQVAGDDYASEPAEILYKVSDPSVA